jgi:hypothetical protein
VGKIKTSKEEMMTDIHKKMRQSLAVLVFFCLGKGAFAYSSSFDPTTGHDPWALFQLMLGVGSQVWYVIKIVLLISSVVGIIFIVMGLQKIRSHATEAQSSGHLKHGLILVLLGGLLFGAPVLTMLVGNSLFGSAPIPVVSQSDVNCQMVNGQYNEGCGVACDGNSAPGPSGACALCPPGTLSSNGSCESCENSNAPSCYTVGPSTYVPDHCTLAGTDLYCGSGMYVMNQYSSIEGGNGRYFKTLSDQHGFEQTMYATCKEIYVTHPEQCGSGP